MRHPSVAQVAVVGIPHPTLGEEVLAAVVCANGESPDAQSLIAWSQERLAKYKYPRRVEYVEALPLGPSGKVLKRELRVRFS